VLEFVGDFIVEYKDIEFIADRALTQQDLDEGTPFHLIGGELLNSADGVVRRVGEIYEWGSFGVVLRELIEVEEVEPVQVWLDREMTDAWRVVVRERREGRFVVEGDRIEILWECERGHMAGTFEVTRNALAPDELRILGARYNRVED
jgi:hypothetical protein